MREARRRPGCELNRKGWVGVGQAKRTRGQGLQAGEQAWEAAEVRWDWSPQARAKPSQTQIRCAIRKTSNNTVSPPRGARGQAPARGDRPQSSGLGLGVGAPVTPGEESGAGQPQPASTLQGDGPRGSGGTG